MNKEQIDEIELLRANSKGLFTECGRLRVRADELDNQCIELRQQLSAAQSRIELLEHMMQRLVITKRFMPRQW